MLRSKLVCCESDERGGRLSLLCWVREVFCDECVADLILTRFVRTGKARQREGGFVSELSHSIVGWQFAYGW